MIYCIAQCVFGCGCGCGCVCSVTQSFPPTLCNPMDCSLTGFSVHGLFQARILEWVAIFSSRGSSWPRDKTTVATWEARVPEAQIMHIIS